MESCKEREREQKLVEDSMTAAPSFSLVAVSAPVIDRPERLPRPITGKFSSVRDEPGAV